MVDAAISLNATGALRHDLADERTSSRLEVRVERQDGLAGYSRLAVDGVVSPAQSALWVNNWIEIIQPDFLVATIERDGVPVLSVVLEVTRNGPLRTARFMS